MEASGKASGVIAIFLLAAATIAGTTGIALNYYRTGEWWPDRFSDSVLVAFALAGFFVFVSLFFSVGVLVSLASPVLKKQILPETEKVQTFRSAWNAVQIAHAVPQALFAVLLVAAVLYAATQEVLVAAIVVSTIVVGILVSVWWRRRERRLSNSR